MTERWERATTRWFWWLVAALVAVRLVSLVGVLLSGQELPNSILGGDARRYAQIITAQGTPYADFEVEYPPVALALIRLTYSPNHLLQLVLQETSVGQACEGVEERQLLDARLGSLVLGDI